VCAEYFKLQNVYFLFFFVLVRIFFGGVGVRKRTVRVSWITTGAGGGVELAVDAGTVLSPGFSSVCELAEHDEDPLEAEVELELEDEELEDPERELDAEEDEERLRRDLVFFFAFTGRRAGV
jgi:hypothetical protein